ncbi:MAG: DnaJ domain-containing protein [Nitrospina sp.]|nr:DnaJ domain-containing protein [Nitrospina sp.]
MRHHFEILGLSPGCTFEEIKRAYKFQAKKWHPDRFPEEARHLQKKAHEQFQKITEAFRELEEHFKGKDQGRYAADQPEGNFQKARTEPGRDTGVSENDGPPPSSAREHAQAPGYYYREWPNGDKYEGQMRGETLHGMGMYTSADGTIYTGQFQMGKPHGQGKLSFTNGDTYTGEFREDRMCGQGTYQYANGDRYIGHFQDDMPHGEGAHILATGKVYAGLWENGYLIDQH